MPLILKINMETVITHWLAKGEGAGKNLPLDMNSVKAMAGRTQATRNVDYRLNRNRPKTSLVRLYSTGYHVGIKSQH